MILFENFKSFLQLVVSNSQTVSQNSVLSDTDYAQAVSDHIAALTPDQNIRLNSTMVDSELGLLTNDELKREIRFEWVGAERLQGWVRPLYQSQGTSGGQYSKIWVRRDDSLGTQTSVPYGTLSDGRRYYVTDQNHGVFYLNEYGQVLGAVPGFSSVSPAVPPDYGAPSSAITFTVGLVEYIAITNQTDHFLNIYDTSDFSLVATFGTPGTGGTPDLDLLDSPVDLAFDETNSILYVSCLGGTPAGATGPGYIASFDVSALPTVTFGSFVAINTGDGTLPQGEITAPRGLHFDPTLSSLWVFNDLTANANTPYPTGYPYVEAGAISVSAAGASNSYLTGHIDGRSTSYWLRQGNSKLHLDDERRKLYIGNFGSVEVFDLATLKHQLTFGYLSTDTTLVATQPLTPALPPSTFPSVQTATAVASDILTVNGAVRNLALFTDDTNNRFVRIPEDAYLGDNLVTFEEMTFTVPLSLHGYLVKGTLPTSKVCIEYRTVSSGAWQRLEQTDMVPASTFFQFRVRVTPALTDILEEKSIKEIVIVGEQE